MKKKLVALLTAAIMVVGSATTVFAAPSVSAGDLTNNKGNVIKVESMTDADAEKLAGSLNIGKEAIKTNSDSVTVTESKDVSASVIKSAAKAAIAKVEELLKVDLDKKVNKGEIKTTVALVAAMDIKVEGTVSEANPVELTFPGYSANDGCIILHLKADDTWEIIESRDVDGVLTGKFTSFSPVVIAKVAQEKAGEGTSSPTTGVVSVLPIIAAAGLAGTVVCGKKVKFN